MTPKEFDRNSFWRKSDERHLLNNDDSKGLPEIHVNPFDDQQDIDLRSPSTPGVADGEVKALLSHNGKCDSLEFQEHTRPPKDRWHFVYLILVVHGIGTLMPWNMFITADKYFVDYKLAGTAYGKDFLSYLGICSQVPNVCFNFANLFIQIRGSLTKRIVLCLLFTSSVFIFTIVMAMLDTRNWPGWFFLLTMFSVVLINGSNGIYQNSVYGLAADLPMNYSNAVVLGTNISGTFVSIVNILVLWLSPDLKTAAIYYFIAALFVLLLCFDTYFILPFCMFYRYFHDQAQLRRSRESAVESKSARISRNTGCLDKILLRARPYVQVVRQAWVQMFSIFFVFFVTLTIFPAMMADVVPLSDNFPIPTKYFTAFTCFLLFNLFAMIGNFVANFIRFPGPKFLWVPVLLRGLMIPYFMLCNYRPEYRTFKVYVDSDWAYVGMGILMALTSGYFSSLVMMYAPRVVEKERARVAGMMAAFFLVLGIGAGVSFTLFVAFVNENLGPVVPLIARNATVSIN